MQAYVRRFTFHNIELVVHNSSSRKNTHKLRYVVCDDRHKFLILNLKILAVFTRGVKRKPCFDFQLRIFDKAIEPLFELIHQLSNGVMLELDVRVHSYELSFVSIGHTIEAQPYQIILHFKLIHWLLNKCLALHRQTLILSRSIPILLGI